MPLESLAQFGKRYGVSKQAVAKWKTKGYLVLDGAKIDVSPSQKRLRDFDIQPVDGDPQPRQPVDDRPQASTPSPPPGGPSTDAQDALSDEAIAAFLSELMKGRFATKAEAERVKENALAGTRLLAFRRASNELVEMAVVRDHYFKLGRKFRDGLVLWVRDVGPLIAGELGVDVERFDEVLRRHVNQHLDASGYRPPDFTKRED